MTHPPIQCLYFRFHCVRRFDKMWCLLQDRWKVFDCFVLLEVRNISLRSENKVVRSSSTQTSVLLYYNKKIVLPEVDLDEQLIPLEEWFLQFFRRCCVRVGSGFRCRRWRQQRLILVTESSLFLALSWLHRDRYL